MRIVERVNPFGIAPDAFDLVFTREEVATLRRASAICAEARQLCEEKFGRVWIDSHADEALAGGEHAFVEFIDERKIEVWA